MQGLTSKSVDTRYDIVDVSKEMRQFLFRVVLPWKYHTHNECGSI